MSRSRNRLLTNLALLVVATIAALGALEVLLRLYPQPLPEETRLRLHWAELQAEPTVSRADPYLGFLYPAHYEGGFERGDAPFRYSTDEHGFRNPVGWPDTADVVIVGDSQAFGFGVSDGDEWPRLLGQRLGVQVVNLGMIGSAPQQYTRVLERFGLSLSPRLVLYCLFPGNDLIDARAFAAWEAAGSPGNFATWRFERNRPDPARDLLRSLLAKSRLAALFRSAVHGLESRFTGRQVEAADGTKLLLAPNVYRSSLDLAHPSNPEFLRTVESVERAGALARDAGSDFLVVLVPTKEEVYLPLAGEPSLPLVEPFARALAERGFEVLDLTPELQEAARDGPALFFTVDGHPNENGNRLIAELVGRRLHAVAGHEGPPHGKR